MTRGDRTDGISALPTGSSTAAPQKPESNVSGPGLKRLVNRLHSLPEVGMRAAMLSEFLTSMPCEQAAVVLCEMHDKSGRDPLHKDAWAAFAFLVEQGRLSQELSGEMYRCLVDQGRRDVAWTLVRPVHECTASMRPLEPGGRRLTLGERKALARKPNRTLIERLAKDPDPSVIRILLRNPKIVEHDVVRLAATKLANPRILREVALNNRWNRSLSVVRALLFNPATPLDTKLRLLPTLRSQDIAEIGRHAPDMELAQAAQKLLDDQRTFDGGKNSRDSG